MIACSAPDGLSTVTRSRAGHNFSIYTSRAGLFRHHRPDQVMDAVAESRVEDGLALVYSRHTTAAIKISEHEPC